MPRNKIRKITEADSLPNVFAEEQLNQTNWLEKYFENNNPFVLEIGCGRGDYVIALAQKNPHINYIGVDTKGARLWTGAKMALKLDIKNVAFLRVSAEELDDYFKERSIEEIWITFPDPFPKNRVIKRRVTSSGFLRVYRKILKENGQLHLKTDDQVFYDFTLESLAENQVNVKIKSENIYTDNLDGDVTGVQTKYEKNHLEEGKTIKYICFDFD